MSTGPLNRREEQIFAFEELRADIQYEILRALKEDDISQSDLAKRLGCSPPWISQFLDDDANLTLESISKVFLALGKRLVVTTEPHNYASNEEGDEDSAAPEEEEVWLSLDHRSSEHVSHSAADKFVRALLSKSPRDEQFTTHRWAMNDNYADDKREAA